MTQTSQLKVEHVVVQSTRSYEDVKAALEERMGVLENTDELARRLAATHPSLDEVRKIVEEHLRSSGFSILSKVEQGQVLSLLGNSRKAIQYAIGNPLLAIQMIALVPEVALYAPLRLAVYEGDPGKTFVAYDRFSSLLAQYQHPEITRISRSVEQKLEALVTEATAAKAEVAA